MKFYFLGHAIEPYSSLTSDVSLANVNNILSIANDFSDDIICLSKIGFIGKKYSKTFEPISSYLWFTCIIIDLYFAINSKNSNRRTALYIFSLLKLLGDLGFCSCDILNDPKYSEFQNKCGLVAGYCGLMKIWLKLK
jgi:hypothetical protein